MLNSPSRERRGEEGGGEGIFPEHKRSEGWGGSGSEKKGQQGDGAVGGWKEQGERTRDTEVSCPRVVPFCPGVRGGSRKIMVPRKELGVARIGTVRKNSPGAALILNLNRLYFPRFRDRKESRWVQEEGKSEFLKKASLFRHWTPLIPKAPPLQGIQKDSPNIPGSIVAGRIVQQSDSPLILRFSKVTEIGRDKDRGIIMQGNGMVERIEQMVPEPCRKRNGPFVDVDLSGDLEIELQQILDVGLGGLRLFPSQNSPHLRMEMGWLQNFRAAGNRLMEQGERLVYTLLVGAKPQKPFTGDAGIDDQDHGLPCSRANRNSDSVISGANARRSRIRASASRARFFLCSRSTASRD